MRIYQIVTIGFIALLAALAGGCSRMTAEVEAEVRQSFGVPADMPMKDLGDLEFHAGIPRRVRLGAGKSCTITASVLTNASVQFNLLYESRGEVIEGVEIQPYSERSQVVLTPRLLASAMKTKSWLCFPPLRPHFVVAMQPTFIP
jgi:hypothetical protein